MKKFKIILPILFLIAVGCDDDGGVSGGSGSVGPPPDWPEDNDTLSMYIDPTQKIFRDLTDTNKFIRIVKG